MTMAVLVAVLAAAASIGIRTVAAHVGGRALIVDRWYWNAYVEASRAQRRFPPDLPQYLLDLKQWYPPLFPGLLVALGAGRRARTLESAVMGTLELARIALLLAVVAGLVGSDVAAVGAAGLAYAVSPVLALYNVQMNPRALGALLLDTGLVAAFWASSGGPAWAWAVAIVAGALVLLSHKMATQLLVFLWLIAVGATRDPLLAGLMPAAVVLAWVGSGGFYARVLRAHGDIVAFWCRNWPWLHADPVRESSIYGEPGYITPARLHYPGMKGVAAHLRRLVAAAPGTWVIAGLCVASFAASGSRAERAVEVWLICSLLWAVLTTFGGPLRALGAGSLYLYNAAFPAALLWGLRIHGARWWWPVAWGAAVALDGAALALRLRALGARRPNDEDGWETLLAFLRGATHGPVLCLPQNLYDELSYRTGQPVLFGGHGFGFRCLEPVYPRLALSVADMRTRYGLAYVVARSAAINDALAADLASAEMRMFGDFRVWTLPRPEREVESGSQAAPQRS